MSQRPVLVTSKTNQPFCVAAEFFKVRGRNFFLVSAEFGGRNQTTEILISDLGLSQNRKIAQPFQTDLGSNVRFDATLLCRHVKARSAVYSVAIEQRHRGNL